MRPTEHLTKIDKNHIWHPFTHTSVWLREQPIIVEEAEGFELIDVEGRRYLDGVSALWCNVHGHREPELDDSLRCQVDKIAHSTLLGLSHRPIIELTEKLVQMIPSSLSRIFYADSGSAAVEAALRIAIEYWQKQESVDAKKRDTFISLGESYHGDTLGSVGVGYNDYFHSSLRSVVKQALRVQPPHYFRHSEGLSDDEATEKSLSEMESVLKEHGETIAAFVVEPLMQGAAGMWRHQERFLKQISAFSKEYGFLLIADEVATGFCKSGELFAVDRASVEPDLLVMGKGLTAGYLPLSCVATKESIFEAFTGNVSERKTFFYGQTYCGNPLAAAVAHKNLQLIEERGLVAESRARYEHFHALLEEQIAPLPHVFEVRSLGAMVGIELTKTANQFVPYPGDELAAHRVILEAKNRDVIIRPLGNVIILMPAPAMPLADLERLVSVTAESISAALDG